eukprot:5522562-Prymnesium_polylepis.1
MTNEPEPFETRSHARALRCLTQPAAAPSDSAPHPRSPAIAAASGRFWHPVTVSFRRLGLR